MQATPLFLGACAFASIAGVVSGTAIDTRPLQRGGIGMNEINRPAIDFASDNGLSDQVAQPDHYAINTPEGRFDVPELSSRGIYAQQRFAWRDVQYTPPPERTFQDDADPGYWNRESGGAAPAVADQAVDAAKTEAPAPEPAQSTATVEGQAKVIDVNSALASTAG